MTTSHMKVVGDNMVNRIIYTPYTPKGYLTDNKEYVGVLRKLTITYGGSMGGANLDIVTKDKIDIDMLNNNKFITIQQLDGSEYTINTNYLIHITSISVRFDDGWIEEHSTLDYNIIYDG